MFNFKVIRLGTAALIWADRPLSRSAAPVVDRTIRRLLMTGTSTLVIDLVRVPAIDEAVVAVFATAAHSLGQRGRVLELRMSNGRAASARDAAQLRSAISWAYPTVR